LRVSFALNSAPPSAKEGDDSATDGFNVSIGPDLLKAASDLRDQLKTFPVRGGRAQI
jgi:hypothetical protein